ncbi:MAG: tetratricopeptide repeat protein [Acidobacteriota bacterium]
MVRNLRLLFSIYWRPAGAIGGILDQGSLLFASLAVLALSFLIGGRAFSFYTPLIVLAAIYVPGVLAVGKLLGIGTAFDRDYAPLLVSTAMVWTAANIPLLITARLFPYTLAYFMVLMFFVVRTVFGTGNGAAAGVVCLSWIPLAAAAFLWRPLQFLLGWVASPFFLFFAYYFLAGEISGLGAGLRRRQNFRRMLEAAAVNPNDGDAQYQLGLIYQERRQYTEAIERFRNAVAIDPTETDAHFQLGRIARRQGRLKDALGHLQTVVNQDERHSQSEVLRELGGLYVAVRQFEDARNELAEYTERRPYDPEGLYLYGQALEGLAEPAEARRMYERAIEAARTAPRYRKRITAPWSRLAEKRLRKMAATP